ncbi:MAG: MarR family transcriptional regulator [Chloroflexota bacterium]
MGTHFDGTAEEILALDCYIKLFRAADSVGQQINAHLRDYDLTTSQFGTLEAIYHLGPMQSGELGQKILKSSGNMTMVIDHLEKRGLVTRQRRKDDRRCVDIHLTEDGRSLIASILPTHVAGVVSALSALSQSEQQQLADLCRTLGLAQADS